MAIEFKNKPPLWENEGTEPTEDEKREGYEVGDKVPAHYMNWQMHATGACIEELQTKLSNENTERQSAVNTAKSEIRAELKAHTDDKKNPHGVTATQIGLGNVDNTSDANKPVSTAQATAIAEAKKAGTDAQSNLTSHTANKSNPHGVTKEQIGLDKVNNTADSEKNVAFASEAGVGRKVKNALTVRFKGGSTEGTDLFTFDGSTGKSINITPDKIGGANTDLSNVDNEDFKDKVVQSGFEGGTPKVSATSTDGITYTATVENVTELVNGMEIIIIPNTKSTSTAIKLNVNGLGDVPIRRPLSFSTFVATSIDEDRLYFLSADTPCRLMYHANYTSGGIWLMADKVKYSAQDLYGTVPVESGGTGGTTPEEALLNLGGIKRAGDTISGKYLAFYNGLGKVTTGDDFLQFEAYKTAGDTNNRRVLALKSSNDVEHCLQVADWAGGTSKYYDLFGKHNLPNPAQIATGSYEGAGNVGPDTPNTLTFPFKPKVVVVQGVSASVGGFCWVYGSTRGYVTPNESVYNVLNWKNTELSWYYAFTADSDAKNRQFNAQGQTYNYVAIG